MNVTRVMALCVVGFSVSVLADAEERIVASASSKTPEVELREALTLATTACRACPLTRELEALLAEFDRAPEPEAARRVLAGRRCLSALKTKGRDVTQWCAPVFDGCRPGLMTEVGRLAKLDRTYLVGNACAERACPTKVVPAAVCEKSGGFYEVRTKRDVTSLLKVVWARELPEPLAVELQAAFASFFADFPLPMKLDPAQLEAASKALGPRLASRGTQANFDAFIKRIGAPHEVRDQSVSWYAPGAKSCAELRYTFEPAHKLELRSPPQSECTGSR